MSGRTTSHGSWPSAFRSLWWRGASSAVSPHDHANSGGGRGRGRTITNRKPRCPRPPCAVSWLPNIRASRYHCADWTDDQKRPHNFEWQRGSMFSIPLNTWHRIVNAASSPALILVASTAPNVMNLFRDSDWIFNCPITFPSRYDGSESYFKPKDDIMPDPLRGLAMRKTNLIPDVFNAELYLDNRRSPGYTRMEPNMAGNVFYGFVGEHVTGRYSKAHAHLSSAVLVCIKGKGYTYTWPRAIGMTPWKDG